MYCEPIASGLNVALVSPYTVCMPLRPCWRPELGSRAEREPPQPAQVADGAQAVALGEVRVVAIASTFLVGRLRAERLPA
jgi:hypothetical protein